MQRIRRAKPEQKGQVTKAEVGNTGGSGLDRTSGDTGDSGLDRTSEVTGDSGLGGTSGDTGVSGLAGTRRDTGELGITSLNQSISSVQWDDSWLVSGSGVGLEISSSVGPTVNGDLLFTSTHSTKVAKSSLGPFTGKSGRNTLDSFMMFRAVKEKERKTFFTKKCQESKKDKKNGEDCSGHSSSEDSEVQVKSTSHSPHYESDTLMWDDPDEASTPKTRSTSDRNYTHLYAPIVIESDSEESNESRQYVQEESTDVLSAADIVSDLSLKIRRTSCCRFNINRANVWDGAVRGFKRASYDPLQDMLVKFTDDEGTIEDAVDTGGPKREFLTLLMDCLRARRIFDGPENRRFLTFNNAAAREDEYFLAGRMIAVSVVHGGPGPRFLSEMVYDHLTGRSDINGTVEDITDETMKAALLEISSAASLDELLMLIDKYASLLQTAGCFDYPQSVEGKDNIVKDFIQWYILYRNQYSIQRFRDGLSTLDVIHALEQHPSVFRPYMCYSVENLKAESLEAVFKAQLCEFGSTRRQEETRILGYWRDYLLDTGGKGL
ncbi:G2/M phase-specific E3 ubiquitin-protein ligase-like [Carassius carassius]|uniref:G2/M phase-specific E3 ubiquitin-protein ligase-like n=1 Tax=Carassius carassius TaxID=217509 RepID=UPI0028691C8D|nr:G2/M phase-specific E3 ubiquitin-protein ligase-like [Carassius carassius]